MKGCRMAYRLNELAILLCTVGVAFVGLVQSTQSATPPPTLSPATVAPSEVVGAVEPRELASMLRQGGLVLWMRHGERDSSSGDVTDVEAAAHDCARQSLLTQAGMTQARSVGAAIRELKLPIAAVYAARLCRTEATAELLGVGPVSKDDRLDEATTWTDRGGDACRSSSLPATPIRLPWSRRPGGTRLFCASRSASTSFTRLSERR